MKLKRNECVVGFDIGGTKINCGVWSGAAGLSRLVTEPVVLNSGPKGLIDQIVRMAVVQANGYKLKGLGVACAGPLDPYSGVLLNPTNLETQPQTGSSGKMHPGSSRGRIGRKPKKWGVVKLAQPISQRLKCPVRLENDAAAAVIGEYQFVKKNVENLVVITLGTGLGVGVIVNGELLRSGRGLHPEGGHIIMDARESKVMCGCGNFGCAETLLSGTHMLTKVQQSLNRGCRSTRELFAGAGAGKAWALKAFESYSQHLAQFMYSMSVMYCPQEIVLAGGFAAGAQYFLPEATAQLRHMMRWHRQGVDLLPKVRVSRYTAEIGLVGACRVVLSA